MSDYKIVNGKKVRVCKYGCETELVWSDDISGFIETKGGVAHTQDRCKQVKSKQKQDLTLEAVLRKLETHGIIINVERLMKQ
ncbi:MAG: hypothetical protein QOK57_00230 [Nitrososphaeraceae archaeon]|nr:hypothetical protein [Nitrososphaeraceae archaeon]